MVGPAKRAYSYDLLVYGSEAGYLSSRAQIELHGPNTQDTIAWVRFCDPGVAFPLDTYNNGIVTMHLPTSMGAGLYRYRESCHRGWSADSPTHRSHWARCWSRNPEKEEGPVQGTNLLDGTQA